MVQQLVSRDLYGTPAGQQRSRVYTVQQLVSRDPGAGMGMVQQLGTGQPRSRVRGSNWELLSRDPACAAAGNWSAAIPGIGTVQQLVRNWSAAIPGVQQLVRNWSARSRGGYAV